MSENTPDIIVIVPSLFKTGRVVATPGALEAFEESNEQPETYLMRHVIGDWGDVDDEDKETNYAALRDKQRLLSAYTLSNGTKIWVITEWDRSVTTFLLPDEY